MLEPGDILQGRYRLNGRLNANDSRQTWLASDAQDDALVVLKVSSLGGLTRWDDLKFLEREARVLQQIQHDSPSETLRDRVPQFRDYFAAEDGSWFALATRYIPGTSLKQQLDRGETFSPDRAAAIARSVLDILEPLHDRQPPVLHRDIKPSNLIAGDDGRIYLIDFGSVQIQPRQLGKSFTVAGTYGYVPLEQFGGQAVPASDLYALGMTLVHLLTGVAPADLPQDNLRVQFRDRLPASTPPRLARWLERLTDSDATRRYASVRAARTALDGRAIADPDPLARRRPQPVSPPPRDRRPAPARTSGREGSPAPSPAPTKTPDPAPEPLPEEPPRRVSQVFKSKRALSIQIPSKFYLKVAAPVLLAAQRAFDRARDRLEALPRRKQVRLGLGTLAAVGLLLAIAPGLLFQAIALVVTVPVFLAFCALPFAFAAWLILSSNGSKWFEGTTLYFTPSAFQIVTRSRGHRERRQIRGKLGEIQDVALRLFADPNGTDRWVLAIATTLPPGAFDSPTETSRTYAIGSYLDPAELEWIQQEIQDWIDRFRQAPDGPPPPAIAGR